MEKCRGDFTADKICRGKAGAWNFVCAPFVLVWKSLTIFCFPCLHVFFWRLVQPLQVCAPEHARERVRPVRARAAAHLTLRLKTVLQKQLCSLCFKFPYEDAEFIGAKVWHASLRARLTSRGSARAHTRVVVTLRTRCRHLATTTMRRARRWRETPTGWVIYSPRPSCWPTTTPLDHTYIKSSVVSARAYERPQYESERSCA